MADASPGPVEQWAAVERYIVDSMIPADPALEAALAESEKAGLPPINVGANQGKFLQLLAQIRGARRMLEIGTLGGYSTIWLAQALPAGGKIITLEFQPKHAEVAQGNFARAGCADRIDLRVGNALELLPKIAAAGEGPFDLTFIDANKDSIPEYFTWALKLSRPGSVIIVDNVIRKGAVADASSTDKDVQGVRRFNAMLATEKRVSGTALQTVGSKGYDGFAVLLVKEGNL
jgi:predicted O-methyltransferase YrrM